MLVSDSLGLNGILLYLASDLIGNDVDILLNEPLQTIKYENNGNHGVVIKTKSNKTYLSKYAILHSLMVYYREILLLFNLVYLHGNTEQF